MSDECHAMLEDLKSRSGRIQYSEGGQGNGRRGPFAETSPVLYQYKKGQGMNGIGIALLVFERSSPTYSIESSPHVPVTQATDYGCVFTRRQR